MSRIWPEQDRSDQQLKGSTMLAQSARPVFRELIGEVVGTLKPFRQMCAEVVSKFPVTDYQNELDDFREAIRVSGTVRLLRGGEVVADGRVKLNVTECNHIPMTIYGRDRIDDVDAYWKAGIVSLEMIRVPDAKHQIHFIADYLIGVDYSEGRHSGMEGGGE